MSNRNGITQLNSSHDSTSRVTDHAADAGRVLVWDGWRGMAILLVLCGHFYDIGWVWEDRMGVDIFFVLSGMLMSVILFERRMSLRDFYVRRFSRIYPVFFVCVLMMFAIAFVTSTEFTLWELISSLTFLRTYTPSDPHIWSSGVTVGHLWSLNVEEHAYVFLSVITLCFVSRKFIAVGLLFVAFSLICLSLYRYLQLPPAEFRLYMIRTESAVVFILLSAGYGLLARQYQFSVPPAAPVLSLAVACVCYANEAPAWLLVTVCPVLLAFSVNHLKEMPAFVTAVLSNSVIRHFGLWSYSIYLWQQIFYQYAWALPGKKLTAFLISIAVGVTSYYLLEQPVRRRLNRRFSPDPTYRTGRFK